MGNATFCAFAVLTDDGEVELDVPGWGVAVVDAAAVNVLVLRIKKTNLIIAGFFPNTVEEKISLFKMQIISTREGRMCKQVQKGMGKLGG